jgi:hypothetical protein
VLITPCLLCGDRVHVRHEIKPNFELGLFW